MNCEDSARVFRDWAQIEGLLAPTAPPLALSANAAELALVVATEAAKQLLRSKQVQFVGFNPAASQIFVFMRLQPPAPKAVARLPQAIGEFAIKYRQGVPHPIGNVPAAAYGAPPYTVRQSATGQRYTCGSSISLGNFASAGTLGCLVRDAAGVMFGLSNNHVSGGCSFAGVGMPVVAPGICDVHPGSIDVLTLGRHARSLPMVLGWPDVVDISANRDAAMFTVRNADSLTSYQGGFYDTPAEAIPLAAGIQVEKVGRTTGHTAGTVVTEIFGPVNIMYRAPQYEFSGFVFFEHLFSVAGTTSVFADEGDSGSLVTTVGADGVRRAVGIVVGVTTDGSSPGGKSALILPIVPILGQLGVSLVSGHNV